jgi:hypothetical protein
MLIPKALRNTWRCPTGGVGREKKEGGRKKERERKEGRKEGRKEEKEFERGMVAHV